MDPLRRTPMTLLICVKIIVSGPYTFFKVPDPDFSQHGSRLLFNTDPDLSKKKIIQPEKY